MRKLSKIAKPALATATSDANGNFVFDQVTSPDRYVMSIQESEDFTFATEVVTCDFKWETGFQCEHPHFTVTGYSISGQVLSYNEAMPNVKVYLHAGTGKIADKSSNSLKKTETDPQGAYRFVNIPCGEYQVVSTYAEN